MRLISLPSKILKFNNHQLDLSQPHIMGILNVTPDSFSDGGKYQLTEHAYQFAMQMIKDGATIIDIGGESTRPGASAVSVEQEIQRVIPVVEMLAKENIILSIDTSEPKVIEAAVAAGAHIWNDVRGLTRPLAVETAVKLDIPVIIMHMRGEPTNMNQLNHYDDITQDIIAELSQRIESALAAGIKKENIIIDPGFGFAKNAPQNLTLLNEFWKLTELGYPLVSALSRKRFIGEALGGMDVEKRAIGSAAAHLLSIQQGASIVRAHDVKATKEVIQIWQAMVNSEK